MRLAAFASSSTGRRCRRRVARHAAVLQRIRPLPRLPAGHHLDDSRQRGRRERFPVSARVVTDAYCLRQTRGGVSCPTRSLSERLFNAANICNASKRRISGPFPFGREARRRGTERTFTKTATSQLWCLFISQAMDSPNLQTAPRFNASVAATLAEQKRGRA